jgi:hypothetical protein
MIIDRSDPTKVGTTGRWQGVLGRGWRLLKCVERSAEGLAPIESSLNDEISRPSNSDRSGMQREFRPAARATTNKRCKAVGDGRVGLGEALGRVPAAPWSIGRWAMSDRLRCHSAKRTEGKTGSGCLEKREDRGKLLSWWDDQIRPSGEV